MWNPLPERKQCDVQQRSRNWAINLIKKENNLHWTDYAFVSFFFYFISLHLHDLCGLIKFWHTPNRQGLQISDTPIRIVTNVFSVALHFQLPPCTICVNTQISKAVMATAFEPVQCIVSTIVPCTRIHNHAFLNFIKTLDMHSKLAICYFPIHAPYASRNIWGE